MLVLLFFLERKTVYEMCISDWSSYVCSSDLFIHRCEARSQKKDDHAAAAIDNYLLAAGLSAKPGDPARNHGFTPFCPCPSASAIVRPAGAPLPCWASMVSREPRVCEGSGMESFHPLLGSSRSEEHTSELQSLMRISYAVFCLKKKKKKKTLNEIQ